jgi:hypothetical protein
MIGELAVNELSIFDPNLLAETHPVDASTSFKCAGNSILQTHAYYNAIVHY